VFPVHRTLKTPKDPPPQVRRHGRFWNTVIAPRTIRAKLYRILALALALVLALLGAGIADQVSVYRQASATAYEVKLLVTLQSFVHEHQKERGLTDGVISGTTAFWAKMPAQRKLTDSALTAVKTMIAGRQDPASVQVRNGLTLVDRLPAIRSAADQGTGDLEKTYDYFTDTNKALTALTLGLQNAADPQLRAGISALLALGEAKEATGEERALMTGALPLGHFPWDWYSEFTEARAERLANMDTMRLWTTPEQQAEFDAIWTRPYAQQMVAWDAMAANGGGRLDNRAIPSTDWYTVLTETNNDMRGVQVHLGDDIIARAGALERDAQLQLVLYSLLAVAAVAVLGGLSVSASRSISGPLRTLARDAADIAGTRLPHAVARVQETGGAQEAPEEVRVAERAGAEVHLVAAAFQEVQQVAFDLATEQAVLRKNATESLVNLGRRNQNLVRRQIGFINKLEHEDADPQQLANLFELDHLATRMRRNAESLLVLAGEASPRPWAQPLTVTDVIRAALSEVEDYRRVTLRRVDQVLINGAVVAEVAHLLAELIENALTFSPPDMDVEIEGRRTSAGYLVAIVDHGLGMSPEAIAEANVRLSGTASFMAEPTKYLGHFVVGSLARRHGIEVRLGDAPAAGVVARVLLPHAVLADHQLTEAPAPVVERVAERAAEPTAVRPAAVSPTAVSRRGERELPVDDAPELQREIDLGQLPPVRTAGLIGHRIGELPAAEEKPAEAPAQAAGGAYAGASRVPGARTPSAARTRNGLVKRPRRTAIPGAVTETAGRWRAGEDRTPERTPDEVSKMLSAFRSAHQRGAADTAATAATTTSPALDPEGGVS
jgi:signal transduction histidine kinase